MSLIQIKFSTVSEVPPTLEIGELAYSEKSKKLFIGSSTGVPVEIGGASLISRVGSLEGTVALIQTEIAALTLAGATVASKVTAIETAIASLSSYNDTALKDRIASVETDLAKIKTDLAGEFIVNDLTVSGDLVVNGTVTTVNSTVTTVEDPVIRIGTNTPSVQDAMDRGIEYKWFDSDSGTIKTGFFGVDQSDGKFKFIPDASQTSTNIFIGNVGTIQANIEGNAATSGKLSVSRKLSLSGAVSGQVLFDGSADADIAVTVNVIRGGTF